LNSKKSIKESFILVFFVEIIITGFNAWIIFQISVKSHYKIELKYLPKGKGLFSVGLMYGLKGNKWKNWRG
jgi:hypothetical protein